MITREVFLGTHIDIRMLCGIEHCFDVCNTGYAYGARRQTCILISIVGRVSLQVNIEDATQLEITEGILHCRVGLEKHATLEAIKVESSHEGFLIILDGLLIDNGG